MSPTRRRSRRKIWISLGLILAIGLGLAYVIRKRNEAPALVYKSIPTVRQPLLITILTTGIVQPENRLEIRPPIAGRIERVLIAEGAQVKRGQILAWMSSTERAALLDAAHANGLEEVKRWEEIYRPTPIMAPIDGTIIQRGVEAGQTFSNQEPVFVMSNRLTIKAQVDETDLAQIKKGQKAEVVLDAYPNEHIPSRVGKIAFDSKTVSNVTTYTVDVLPLATPSFMLSGMTANVTFYIEEKTAVLTVPNEALKFKEGAVKVLVENPADPQQPIERFIKIGLSDGRHTEVLEGLEENEKILMLDINLMGTGKGPSANPFMPFGGGPKKGGR